MESMMNSSTKVQGDILGAIFRLRVLEELRKKRRPSSLVVHSWNSVNATKTPH